MKFSSRLAFLVFSGMFVELYGCGSLRQVGVADLDWRPAKLTMSRCPDLSGNYIFDVVRTPSGGYASDLLPIYSGSIYELWKTANISPTTGRKQQPLPVEQIPVSQSYYLEPSQKQPKENASNILHIQQTANKLIQGEKNGTRTVTRLGNEMAGCVDGALILRTLEINGGADIVPRSVVYGELEIRKDADGSLRVLQRKRQQSIQYSSGVLGDRKEFPPVLRSYTATKP